MLTKLHISTENDWRPVSNLDRYLYGLRVSNHPQHFIDEIIKKHEEYYLKNPVPSGSGRKKVSVRFPYESIDHVKIETVVEESGKVSVNTSIPFENFLNEKNPEKIIEMYRNSGFTDVQIMVLEKMFQRKRLNGIKASEHLDQVMGRYQGKSSSRTKKKSIRARFATKKSAVVKAMEQEYMKTPEEDEGSGEVSDDEGEEPDTGDHKDDNDDDQDGNEEM